MMLNNYYNAIHYLASGSQEAGEIIDVNGTRYNSVNVPIDTATTLKMAHGALGCLRAKNLTYNKTYYWQLALGSGGTPPALTDTKMEAEVTALEVTSTTNEVVKTDQNFRVVNTHTVKNTGTEAVTIREVGYLGVYILMSRTVLESPVTLQPGETGIITVTTDIPGPVA